MMLGGKANSASGSPPQTGVDIEPGAFLVSDWLILGVQARGNVSGSITCTNSGGHPDPTRVLIALCDTDQSVQLTPGSYANGCLDLCNMDSAGILQFPESHFRGWVQAVNTKGLLVLNNAAAPKIGIQLDAANVWQFLDTLPGNFTGPVTFQKLVAMLSTGGSPLAGKAVLVAGTKAVAAASITANSIVMLSRKSAGGAIGDLTYTINAGVGFTINSASGTDTSTVGWVILDLI
jgi:hypothetical protein